MPLTNAEISHLFGQLYEPNSPLFIDAFHNATRSTCE